MTRLLSFIYAYYNSPRMYLRHVEEWQKYPDFVKRNLSTFVTDDCSPKYKLRKIAKPVKGINTRYFEITKKVPWNWLACRNIGAKHSHDKWLLITDIDHLVTVKQSVRLYEFLTRDDADPDIVYLLSRRDAPDLTKYKPHNDSFLMSRDLYWKIGGYDEELAGNYGTSGKYRRRAFAVAKGDKRLKIYLTRYHRSVIPDASTLEFVRKGEGRDKDALRRIVQKKKDEGREKEISLFQFPYREIKV